jgi:carbonic anhydrase/acetyltransferase-like protein (isoleucine patch superfamily)
MIEVYDGVVPSFKKEKYVHYTACVIGKVTCGKCVNIWANAVLRGDENNIIIGQYTNIQDGSVVHIDIDKPTIVGDYVTVGHNCNLHGCKIGNNSLIGIGSIVLDGAQIGNNCIIAAGSIVPPRKVVPDNTLFIKGEFKPLSQEQIDGLKKHAIHYWDLAKKHIATATML